MTKRLIWLRYLSWTLIVILFVCIFIDGALHPSRADLIFNDFGDIAYKNILWVNNYASILCVILFVIATALLIITLSMRSSLPLSLKQSLLALSQFVYCSYVWVLTDSYLLSFVTSNTALCALLSYISFTVMFAFLFEFIMHLIKPMKEVTVMCYILYVLEVINLLNYFFQFVKKSYLIYPVHIISIFGSIIIIKEILKLHKQEKTEIGKYVLNGYVSMAIIGVFALLLYYLGLDIKYTIYYTIGIIIFCIFLTLASTKKVAESIVEQADERAYKKIAYTDEMTGLKNKSAYVELEKQPLQKDSIFVMLDLNDLKTINDTYGHRMGDEVIVIASKTITKFFGSENCYRFGGDEFVVVLNDLTLNAVIEKIDSMKEYMDNHNKNSEIKINFAIGYAKQLPGDTVQSLFLRADQAMYKDKFASNNSRESKQRDTRKVFDTTTNQDLEDWYTKEIDLTTLNKEN